MSTWVWGAGKNALGAVCGKKHVGKQIFRNRAPTGGVRKGGIIKGVWLPRGRHHPLKRSVEGVGWQSTEHYVVETWR